MLSLKYAFKAEPEDIVLFFFLEEAEWKRFSRWEQPRLFLSTAALHMSVLLPAPWQTTAKGMRGFCEGKPGDYLSS